MKNQWLWLGIFGTVTAVIGVGLGFFLSNSNTERAANPATQLEESQPDYHAGISATDLQQPVGPVPSSQQGVALPGNVEKFDVGPRNVKAMLADGNIIWVGTSEGVIQHNMETLDYKVFNNKNSSLISNGVFYLDKIDDVLFVGTYGGGLSTYNGTDWKNYNIPQGLADPFVYGTVKVANGDIWIATWSGANQVVGGNMDDTTAWKTFTEENTNGGLPNDWVYGVGSDTEGNIWLATEGGLAKYDGKTWQNWNHEKGLGAPYDKVKDDLLKTADPSKKSKHHARQKTEMGLTKIEAPYNPNYIVSMLVDSKNRVWCGTWGGGLSVFENGKFSTYTTNEGLAGNYVSVVKEAPDGTIWVGANTGLSKVGVTSDVSNLKFTNYTENDGLFNNYVFSLAFPNNKSTWIGSYGGVSHYLNGLN